MSKKKKEAVSEEISVGIEIYEGIRFVILKCSCGMNHVTTDKGQIGHHAFEGELNADNKEELIKSVVEAYGDFEEAEKEIGKAEKKVKK